MANQHKSLFDWIEKEANARGVTHEEFRQVLQRLLNNQVLAPDFGPEIEKNIYRLYMSVKDLIDDYLAVAGLSIVNHTNPNAVIVYPPNTDAPGLKYEASGYEHDAFPMRRKVRVHERSFILLARHLFEQKVMQAEVEADGCITVSIEEFTLRYTTLFKRDIRSLADLGDNLSILKRLRIAEYKRSELNHDTILRITPIVQHFTFEQAFKVLEELEAKTNEEK
ncbi:hypothetical protein JCM19239_7724 [Vibrio variabilis]|uniref:DUF4194 domain-containing protein n=1 Tax=Vibrio variabilis TaxID=990271 RepID=A0ABQ0J4V6_9VIBR|nr:hypothetical protein JCM19239_7724 [Vibrio variabilis]